MTRKTRKSPTNQRRPAPKARFRGMFIEQLEDRRMLNADFQLLQDINSTSKNDGSAPADFISVGNQVFFTASTPTKGRELWISNGADDGTRIVKDITVGVESSRIQDLTVADGKLFFIANSQLWMTDFTADDGTFGTNGNRELWKSDGTEAGTVVVKDFTPNGGRSGVSELTDVNGTLYFVADVDGIGQEVWQTDGTEPGTVLVKDILPGAYPSYPRKLTSVLETDEFGGVTARLFFFARDPEQPGFVNQLWVSTTLPQQLISG